VTMATSISIRMLYTQKDTYILKQVSLKQPVSPTKVNKKQAISANCPSHAVSGITPTAYS